MHIRYIREEAALVTALFTGRFKMQDVELLADQRRLLFIRRESVSFNRMARQWPIAGRLL